MSDATETPDTTVEVVTAKHRITIPRIPVKKALVTTLAVVGGVVLVKAVKDRLQSSDDTSDSDVEVETSTV